MFSTSLCETFGGMSYFEIQPVCILETVQYSIVSAVVTRVAGRLLCCM